MSPPGRPRQKKGTRGQSWNEETMYAAMNAVQRGQLTQRAAATRFNIPRRTLRDHLKVGDCKKRLGRKPILSDRQEADLVARIKRFAKIGVPLTPKFIKKQAFLFCEKNEIKNNFNNSKRMAGDDWLRCFLRRNQSISKRKPQIMNPARAQKLNKPIVEQHFQSVRELYDDLNIREHPERLYNMDEKGSRITVHSQHTVLAEKGSKRVHLIAPEHAENVTIAMCVNAVGTAIPPMIIFKGCRKRSDLKENLPAGTVVKMAPKGSMTSDLFVRFIKHLGKFKVGGKCLLIFDGAKCHLSIEAVDEAEKHDIVLYCLPSNTTHELQPLDKSVNKSFEHHWDEAVISFLYDNPNERLTKATFNIIFSKVWPKCMTHTNIVNGFKGTGLFPLDPDAIPEEAYAPSILTEKPCPLTQDRDSRVSHNSESDIDVYHQISGFRQSQSVESDDHADNISEISWNVENNIEKKSRLVAYSSSTECSEEEETREKENIMPQALSTSVLTVSCSELQASCSGVQASCSGLQKFNRETTPDSSESSRSHEDINNPKIKSKLRVADIYSSSSEENLESEDDNVFNKGNTTPKKQTILCRSLNINIADSGDTTCSDDEDDNLPLNLLMKQNDKTSFQELLPTPNYAIVKNVRPRKKAMNYKGQKITKNLFTEKKEMPKKRKVETKKNSRNNTVNKKAKKTKRDFKKINSKKKKVTKENDDKEDWYCHACRKNEKLAMRQCSLCLKWYHEDCVGLTKKDKEFICSDC